MRVRTIFSSEAANVSSVCTLKVLQLSSFLPLHIRQDKFLDLNLSDIRHDGVDSMPAETRNLIIQNNHDLLLKHPNSMIGL